MAKSPNKKRPLSEIATDILAFPVYKKASEPFYRAKDHQNSFESVMEITIELSGGRLLADEGTLGETHPTIVLSYSVPALEKFLAALQKIENKETLTPLDKLSIQKSLPIAELLAQEKLLWANVIKGDIAPRKVDSHIPVSHRPSPEQEDFRSSINSAQYYEAMRYVNNFRSAIPQLLEELASGLRISLEKSNGPAK